MTTHGGYTEHLHLMVSPDEKAYIMSHCPQDVSLSRFVAACAMLRCEQIEEEHRKKTHRMLAENSLYGDISEQEERSDEQTFRAACKQGIVPMGKAPTAEELQKVREEHPEQKGMDMGDMWPSRMTYKEADE